MTRLRPRPTLFDRPSKYFSWFFRSAAEEPWLIGNSYTSCTKVSYGQSAPQAVRVVALSGKEIMLVCADVSDYSEETAATDQLEVDEVAQANASRAALEAGSARFSSIGMLLSLLKHEPDSFDDQAWTAMTKDEISVAQVFGTTATPPGFNWVFPVAELQGRNLDIAAEELMPAFREEVLRRAQSAPDTFIVQAMVGNLLASYDIDQLPLQAAPTPVNAAPQTLQSRQAAAFCASYQKRLAQAQSSNNSRLEDTLRTRSAEFNCVD